MLAHKNSREIPRGCSMSYVAPVTKLRIGNEMKANLLLLAFFGRSSWSSRCLLFRRIADRWDDPHLEFAFDVLAEMDLDRVEAEFLEGTLEANLIRGDRDVVLLERLDDFARPDRAVQVAFVVGVGFDRNALLVELFGQLAQSGEALVLDLQKFGFVLFDHPLVMVTRQRGEPLRQQVVGRIPAFDGDDFALLAQVIDRLDQEQLHAVIARAGKPIRLGLEPLLQLERCHPKIL